MDKERVVSIRNGLMLKIIWILSMLITITNIFSGSTLTNFYVLMSISLPFCILITILHGRKRLVFFTMHLISLYLIGILFILNIVQLTTINVLLFLMPIIILGLYPSLRVHLYTNVLSTTAFLYFGNQNATGLFDDFGVMEQIVYVLIFLTFSFLMITMNRFHESLIKKFQVLYEEAEKGKRMNEEQSAQLEENHEELIAFHEVLQQQVDGIRNVSGTTKDMFQESEHATRQQNQSIQHIMEASYVIKEQSEQLHSISFALNEKIDDSMKHDAELSHSITTLQKEIQDISNISEENVIFSQTFQTNTTHIHSIINSIEELSKQIQLLSLNASIEAARAGENGKGFSVVAENIKHLSLHTKQDIEKIKKVLEEIAHLSVTNVERNYDTLEQVKQGVEIGNMLQHHIRESNEINLQFLHNCREIENIVQHKQKNILRIHESLEQLSSHSLEHISYIEKTKGNMKQIDAQLDVVMENFKGIQHIKK